MRTYRAISPHRPHNSHRYLLLWLLVVLSLGVAPQVAAFDTGHHQDVTREALQDEGFPAGGQAIKVVQVANWFVDYYSARPDLGNNNLKQIHDELLHLHFDNLDTASQVTNYWARLTINTRQQIIQAASEVRQANTPVARTAATIKLLSLIGMSLHAVQDFYSHSNWVETYPMLGGSYRTNTWFDTAPVPSTLHTGRSTPDNPSPTGDDSRDHGSYGNGMNHDSYNRPGWPQAYVFAYSATRQWVSAIRGWVNGVDPNLWTRVVNFSVSGEAADDLEEDLNASRRLSEWVKASGKDGTWKGKGSGSTVDFTFDVAAWLGHDSVYLRQFRVAHVHRPLVAGLNNPNVSPGPAPVISSIALGRRAIEVRTLRVAEVHGPDSNSEADYFAEVTVGGQKYIESMQINRKEIRPDWLTIKLVPATETSVRIQYWLKDEDGGLNFGEDDCDVNPTRGKGVLDFDFHVETHSCSGDISGVHDRESSAASLQGEGDSGPDKDPAALSIYVTEHGLYEPSGAGGVSPGGGNQVDISDRRTNFHLTVPSGSTQFQGFTLFPNDAVEVVWDLDKSNQGTWTYTQFGQGGTDYSFDIPNPGWQVAARVGPFTARLPKPSGLTDEGKHKGEAQDLTIPFSAGDLIDSGGLAIWGFGYRAGTLNVPRAAHKAVVILVRNDRLGAVPTMTGEIVVEPGATMLFRSWFTSSVDTRLEFRATSASGQLVGIDILPSLINWTGILGKWTNATGGRVTISIVASQRDSSGNWQIFPMNRGAKVGSDLYVLGGVGQAKQGQGAPRYDVLFVALRTDRAL